MRDWYKKHIDTRKRPKIPVYAIIAVNVIVAFTIFKSGSDIQDKSPAYPYVLTQKLTTDLAKKNLSKDSGYFETDIEEIRYIIESSIVNIGSDGFVKVKAFLDREDTTITKESTFYMSTDEKIKTIINFDPIEYKDLKRNYRLEVSAIDSTQ